MTKYYRVIKENFLWEVGAIICNNNPNYENGYCPIEDIWHKVKDQDEYISIRIVEGSPEYFERVYKSDGEKFLFKTAEQLKSIYTSFKS